MSRDRSAEYYRQHACDYDASAQRTLPLRRRTIRRLALQPGDTVLDVGCGTGLSFSYLLDGIGSAGTVIGVEPSADMLALAQARVAAAGWQNVRLLAGAMETAVLPVAADAVLLNYTHDVMRSPAALAGIFRQTAEGAQVAAAGVRHPSRWLDPFRWYRRFKSRSCYTSTEGLDAPWDLLAGFVPDLQVEATLLTTGYIAWGHYQRRDRE